MTPETKKHFEKVVKAADERWAEAIELKFLQDGRQDQSRGNTTIQAILRVGNVRNTNLSGGDALKWRGRVNSAKTQLHIAKSLYTGPEIKKGDTIRAITRDGMPWFDVLHANYRDQLRIVLELGEA
ncbi:hypothetical protein SAMN04488518_113112 [Pseudovibrio ascidiaceicola]|uniref:Uncharacterized protein n=1 Tax=Pseudovibrio ascidiaceicola TaxID=285279 RepID=A0A1I4E409_9HYPH|nr:hypothetical protein [Pseudovibrio ascidiaceicola]SFK99317.1 hypothetical protein SAMN04488518_113112 [Pseudovibrio ascidiaceicola]